MTRRTGVTECGSFQAQEQGGRLRRVNRGADILLCAAINREGLHSPMPAVLAGAQQEAEAQQDRHPLPQRRNSTGARQRVHKLCGFETQWQNFVRGRVNTES